MQLNVLDDLAEAMKALDGKKHLHTFTSADLHLHAFTSADLLSLFFLSLS